MEFKITELNNVTATEKDTVDYFMIFMNTASFIVTVC